MDEQTRDTTGIGAALRRLFARDAQAALPPLETMSAPAFRALVAERLRTLERDVAEVRARVNGLLFVVAGAVVTQVVLRLFA
ncbi:MAG TPA: hypothetical protein VEZ14_09410 [Dehalococcoidia bacterium]|nr:hypothetical protein [Dehalococcoidia bacterium]